MIFYHVDRLKSINACGTLEIPIQNPSLPYGTVFGSLSQHGNNYLLSPQNLNFSREYEMTLEYIRATKFPHLPSRFQCLFASKSKEEAIDWAKQFCATEQFFHIVEIECDKYFEFDYSWLSSNQISDIQFTGPIQSLAFYFDIANQYWKGNKTHTPKLEILIPYPLKVIKIEDYISHVTVNSVVLRK